MNKTIQEEFEDLKAFTRHPALPVPVADEKDNTDDYEDFDDGEMLTSLWHKGEENYEDELMSAEDY